MPVAQHNLASLKQVAVVSTWILLSLWSCLVGDALVALTGKAPVDRKCREKVGKVCVYGVCVVCVCVCGVCGST